MPDVLQPDLSGRRKPYTGVTELPHDFSRD